LDWKLPSPPSVSGEDREGRSSYRARTAMNEASPPPFPPLPPLKVGALCPPVWLQPILARLQCFDRTLFLPPPALFCSVGRSSSARQDRCRSVPCSSFVSNIVRGPFSPKCNCVCTFEKNDGAAVLSPPTLFPASLVAASSAAARRQKPYSSRPSMADGCSLPPPPNRRRLHAI